MTNRKTQALQQELVTIHQLLQAGQSEEALTKLKPLLRKWASNADAVHLAALCYKALGQTQTAQEYFIRTLALNNKQPQVHNNLGNLYKSLEQFSDAENHYLEALKLQPNYPEAMRNLALCLGSSSQVGKAGQEDLITAAQQIEKTAEAISWFQKVLDHNPRDVIALCGLADLHRDSNQLAIAKELYQHAISIAPEQLNPWYKLAQTFHLNGELDEAQQCYQRAHQLAPSHPAVIQSFASLVHERGATQQALELFNRGVELMPEDINLQERFNEILWESEFANQFGNSYRQAIIKHPENVELRRSFISLLFRAGEIHQAGLALEAALELFGDDSELRSLQGQIEADQQNYDLAESAFESSLANSFTKDAAQNLVKVLILKKDYQQAQKVLDRAFDKEQNCQLSWALQSLVWRLNKDPRYAWLNDYDQLVQAYELETPEGYSSLQDYLEKLKSVLLKLHQTEHAPLQQTLRNGTQTAARLLHRHEPELVQLKQGLAKIVQRYVDAMPEDQSHPLLKRKSKQFEFSGSWSVRLQANGFHVNHVHPAGWISSSCYIAMPPSMSSDKEDRQGWIKFGESPLALGELEVIEKAIKPEPGMVVLFPSYMWHGTYPFSGEEGDFRLTSPFDVLPK